MTPGLLPGSVVEATARICHELNRAYCEALGDLSQRPWPDAPGWVRASAMEGVIFHLTHPLAGPEGSHGNWMEEKIRDGWRYGELKDPEQLTHPCIVPFGQLPSDQQVKDTLFWHTVHAVWPVLYARWTPGVARL